MCLIKQDEIKSKDIAPDVFNLDTWSTWVVIFTLWPPYIEETALQYVGYEADWTAKLLLILVGVRYLIDGHYRRIYKLVLFYIR